ncbi:MAG TPA: PrsW family intramembrane metalloprotease [Candidatus Paceibacterota bacterium]|nr:PrsW family intramembrane metalloprotease [Candidatus Paceibacterota bacterium]HMP18848.1 PrsW family intramembrane metalloprotease [Candidatus Paceibacterota bacterium]HMP85570.1 PrsW family intramembrane metalloprotease [Candidatus Paceibacterota bacterium]
MNIANLSSSEITILIFGGILPPIIWLIYWLQQDKKNPEPKRLLFASFLFGMLTVPIAAFLNSLFANIIINQPAVNIYKLFFENYFSAIILIILWAGIEEFLKLLAGYIGGISTKENNEPLDSVIYLITAALGFATLENIFYIYGTLVDPDYAQHTAILVGNARFIGSTLLHISASATIGIFMAFSFYKDKKTKTTAVLIGFVLATALHTIFNSFIIRSSIIKEDIFVLISFSIVWTTIILIIILLEKIKILNKNQNEKKENIV